VTAHISVYVVDDHEMVRRGIRDLADEETDIDVVGESATLRGSLEDIGRLAPDVALLDLRLPDGDGVELCREIRSRYPDVKCLMFTSYADEDALVKSIMAGASGYLLKLGEGDEVSAAIRTVAGGGSLIDPATTQSVLHMLHRTPAQSESKLSSQQERVLDLIVEGLTNREIAERLELAEKTVKNYVSAILDKLHVRSRTQAAVYGARHRRDRPSDDPA
jgi:DNA-binding NarL/FixJ family response regulator